MMNLIILVTTSAKNILHSTAPLKIVNLIPNTVEDNEETDRMRWTQ